MISKHTLVLIMLLIASSMALNIRKSRSGKVLKENDPVEVAVDEKAPVVVQMDLVITDAKQAFDKVDTDKTNNLNENQVKVAIGYFCDLSGLPLPKELVLQEAFIKSNKNLSGNIDFSEFLNLLKNINDVVQEHVHA